MTWSWDLMKKGVWNFRKSENRTYWNWGFYLALLSAELKFFCFGTSGCGLTASQHEVALVLVQWELTKLHGLADHRNVAPESWNLYLWELVWTWYIVWENAPERQVFLLWEDIHDKIDYCIQALPFQVHHNLYYFFFCLSINGEDNLQTPIDPLFQAGIDDSCNRSFSRYDS